ncbi:FecR family protein [Chryseobacterium sp. 22543]|uniref:FecR family protein n=1 Tax=Chryseobacterium sp. 22543 TaxID=3453940 RepID=UPI003F84A96F
MDMEELNIPGLDDLEWYFAQKLVGSLNDKDLQYIDTLIEHNEQVGDWWHAYCKEFNPDDINNQFARLDQVSWKPIGESRSSVRLQPKIGMSGKKRLAIYIAAAIALSIFLIKDPAGLLIPKRVNPSIRSQLLEDRVVLELAEGRVIDLSKFPESDLKGITYDSLENVLTFNAIGAYGGQSIVKVPATKSLTVLLSDGSKMLINSGSEVKFPAVFPIGKREMHVKGEIYLSVAKDEKRPFKVITDAGEVQVLGTEFNLNSYNPEEMKVSLVKGSIRVVTGDQQKVIKPGTTAMARKDAIDVQVDSDGRQISWKEGLYYFQESDLNELQNLLKRWYNVTVYIDNHGLSNQKITGVIDRNKALNVFLDNLTEVTTIKYAIDADHNVHLR